MTREEAQKELAELEPKEQGAWQLYDARVKRRDQDYMSLKQRLDKIHPEAQSELLDLDSQWSPLYRRKQLLKSFLEIAS